MALTTALASAVDSVVQPSIGATDCSTAHSEAWASRCSSTIRTERSRSSGENRLGRPIGSDAALLAGLLKAPSAYATTVDLERAVERRNLVLSLMRDAGAIDDATYKSALAKTVQLSDGLRPADTDSHYSSRLLKNSVKWDRQIDPGVLPCSQHR